ncbi:MULTISPECIES: hypothetical protein [Kamptonema]|uniref:hypothetical protein n=1 Tax=Kamptonema TaxID=1501433 RepID=UPI0001DACC40|nr:MULTISPECIES: hypothetical protein [Kamptonema]CBN56321.1 hypothetical protein OSCI_2990010 [Kamptonema sp. PCC 6506]
MNELKYPHLFLFTYNWKDRLNSQQVSSNEKGYIPFSDIAGNLPIQGFSKSFSLTDVEANLFGCAAADSESQNSQSLSCFQDFKEKINSKFKPTANLHKTWMLLGYLPENIDPKDAKIVAKNAYESFLPSKKWSEPQAGKFMGGITFEIWDSAQNWQNLAAEENSRIAIIIFRDKITLEKISYFYEDWVNLFYYRNKILWAYSNNLQTKAKLDLSANFFPTASNLPVSQSLSLHHTTDRNLENLKKDLSKNLLILSKFTANLAYFESQHQTIQTNLHNYKERLNEIETKARKEGEGLPTQLDCLSFFSEIAQNKYQAQIDKEIASITSSVKVWETWIDTLRAMVESQQIESDRDLELEIARIGVGLGAASVVASLADPLVEVITPFPAKKIENGKEILIPANAVFNFGLALLLSAVIGIACGYAGGKLWSWMRSRTK